MGLFSWLKRTSSKAEETLCFGWKVGGRGKCGLEVKIKKD